MVPAGLRLPVRVTALAAVAENMPGSRAYKPGDIITYANKKTVEIVNTDAEGRLILADALIMAGRQKPDVIIEFSCTKKLETELIEYAANDRKALLSDVMNKRLKIVSSKS